MLHLIFWHFAMFPAFAISLVLKSDTHINKGKPLGQDTTEAVFFVHSIYVPQLCRFLEKSVICILISIYNITLVSNNLL